MNKHPEYLLNQISSPADLKKLDIKQMQKLAEEIRTLILEKDAAEGGQPYGIRRAIRLLDQRF